MECVYWDTSGLILCIDSFSIIVWLIKVLIIKLIIIKKTLN